MAENKFIDNKKVPEYNLNDPSIYDINDIYKILPHRYPFILIDKVLKIQENSILTLKNVTINEPFFSGHFPDNPVMPGVLQVEAMAQSAAILMVKQVEDPSDYWTYFIGIDNCKFRQMVIPGDTLIFDCHIKEPLRRNMIKVYARTFLGNKLACEASLTAMIVKKDNTT